MMSDGMEMIPKEAIVRMIKGLKNETIQENLEFLGQVGTEGSILWNNGEIRGYENILERLNEIPTWTLTDPTGLPSEYHELWLQEVQVDND